MVVPFGTGPLTLYVPDMLFCVFGPVAFELMTSVSSCAGAAVESVGDVPIVAFPVSSIAWIS